MTLVHITKPQNIKRMTQVRKLTPGLMIVSCLVLAGSGAIAEDSFGAISYSRIRGAYATAINMPTRSAAEHAALASCGRMSRDCSSPVWVLNGCVSIAIGRANGFGSGWGSTRIAAEWEALAVCEHHARACAVRHTACTGE